MAGEILEVLAISQYTKDGEVKKRFTKCGIMFPLRDGSGYSMRLDASAVSGEYLAKVKTDRKDSGAPTGNPSDIPF
jgi:hypothetical protein